jgi:glycosyltransferase involved in cell wall biosynthesis
MRIVIDATAAARQRAGVGRFARGILAGLGAIDAHNDYFLITTGKQRIQLSESELPASHRWLRLPVPERFARIAWQRTHIAPPPSTFVRNADVFFTPDFALPRRGSIPSILTVHDLSFLTHPECADDGLRRYLSTEVPRSIRSAAAVVAVSETTASALTALLGVSRSRIGVVPNGVDQQFSGAAPGKPAPDDAAPFGLPDRYILAVGTLEPRKNYMRLLKAMSLVTRRSRTGSAGYGTASPPLTLAIAGREGWLYEPIFREVARLGLGSTVRFFTDADDADLRALYRHARAFICPSLYEGFGIPPLEAMTCGVPVAASTGGALPEVLGDAALSFDPLDVDAIASAIERIVEDDTLRSCLRMRGYSRAREYTWERSAFAALGLFERVAAA